MATIFKAYDIRGVYPGELDEKTAYKIGRAFVTFLNSEKVLVGQDCRVSSPKLYASLVKGITDQGATVINIGLASTPLLYFAAQDADAIMVTASHNPKQYNGFKLMRKGAVHIGQSHGMESIKDLVEADKWKKPKKKGRVTKKDYLRKYVSHVRKFKGKLKPLKVVMDAGNGMASITADKVFKGLKPKITKLFFKLDGTFPNHAPNPMDEKSLAAIKKEVKKRKAACGIVFDGDCDRIRVIDEKGNAVNGDTLTGLIGCYILQKHEHALIMYDVRHSLAVREEIMNQLGRGMMTRVGHAFIKELMREEDALFAGELSGHYYFKNNNYCDSGEIAAMLVLRILSEAKKPLSHLLKPFQKYHNSGELSFTVGNPYAAMKKAENAYQSKADQSYHIDGISMEFADWWFNLRPSHTEPVIRLVIEAKTKALLDRKKKELEQLLKKA